MAFWAVGLRPGSPYTHRYRPSQGRLRISKAALVSYYATRRTLVQCTLGNRTPKTLCIFNPGLDEMCHLDVEFQEEVDVLFSVRGPSSVHLSGYYLQSSSANINIARDQPSSESYGEDIGESDSEYSYESEESYESSFIDDGDSMDYGDVFSSPYCHKPAFELQRRVEKQHPADNCDDNIVDSPHMPTVKRDPHSLFYSSSRSEDEGLLMRSEIMERLRDEAEKESSDARKRKYDAINHDHAAPTYILRNVSREVTEINGSSWVSERELEKQKKSKKNPLEPEDEKHSNNTRTFEDGLIIQELLAGYRFAKVASKGNKVYINYVGRRQDGKIVESNVWENLYKFTLGAEEVIPAWNRGIMGMRVGGKRRLTIPPSLRRIGAESVGESSTDSTIIYEVELVFVC